MTLALIYDTLLNGTQGQGGFGGFYDLSTLAGLFNAEMRF